jgi:hypothetical protein
VSEKERESFKKLMKIKCWKVERVEVQSLFNNNKKKMIIKPTEEHKKKNN